MDKNLEIKPIDPYRVYTQPEVLKILRCSRSSLNKALKNNQIRSRKIGHYRLFLGQALLDYFQNHLRTRSQEL